MNLSTRLQVIVAIQIAGSAYAAFSFINAYPGFENGAIANLVYGVVLAVSVFGFVSGLMLWTGKAFGYLGSVVTHVIQIPLILSSALAYKFAFGIGVFLKLFGPIKLVGLQFGGSAILVLAPEQNEVAVAINLYALFALLYLVRDGKALKSSRSEEQA